ncbi:hypothetical protein [Caulobacter sp. 17J65-9]|uniref:hypothetical protein n=1 Tax=Caulobacter sp. 17J65-9 TaxID=2709382 RepID=UPI0013CD81B8|nr:hypothetical protein [Caulobacter sp. 17J65-9]NEX93077.1 hypothetical protein [Caulobacter sp. 17J65-9]
MIKPRRNGTGTWLAGAVLSGSVLVSAAAPLAAEPEPDDEPPSVYAIETPIRAGDLVAYVARNHDAAPRDVHVRWLDLNADGRLDAIAQITNSLNCGSHGCSTILFLGANGGTVVIVPQPYVFPMGEPYVTRRYCNGFRVIQTMARANSWCWRGSAYRFMAESGGR